MTITEPTEHRAAIARDILAAMPEWFAIPALTEQFVREADTAPVFVASDLDPIGFLALRPNTPAATEAFVVGVMPAHHRRGVGRALFAAAEASLLRRGVRS